MCDFEYYTAERMESYTNAKKYVCGEWAPPAADWRSMPAELPRFAL